MKVIRVRTDDYTAGLVVEGGVVTRSSRHLRFMIGWGFDKARGTIKRNGWAGGELKDPLSDKALLASITETKPPEAAAPVADAISYQDYTGAPRRKIKEPPPPRTVPEWHLCHCGDFGSFGYGASWLKGVNGIWYCFKHKPVENSDGEIQHGKNAHLRTGVLADESGGVHDENA